ncbi:hypothetical protein M406DRAFT_333978 [Cryphonectria parasitica EP155]|uniref:Uncharacterized protein n=1 Tax=Cryphonectria parasitica (strain ATCC 38755 / EP155) TaxID=660469 RepID=A0A9P4XVZ4_CRYP1|nr:uncharacterized protein M406DRAFT_333978 [Cryphonectria parasitica EP155]KAF3761933.1 hypothetical protein M406DRAFT_333978 [Cryphonectria parasitica EP155]
MSSSSSSLLLLSGLAALLFLSPVEAGLAFRHNNPRVQPRQEVSTDMLTTMTFWSCTETSTVFSTVISIPPPVTVTSVTTVTQTPVPPPPPHKHFSQYNLSFLVYGVVPLIHKYHHDCFPGSLNSVFSGQRYLHCHFDTLNLGALTEHYHHHDGDGSDDDSNSTALASTTELLTSSSSGAPELTPCETETEMFTFTETLESLTQSAPQSLSSSVLTTDVIYITTETVEYTPTQTTDTTVYVTVYIMDLVTQVDRPRLPIYVVNMVHNLSN